jgi:hypothetical protein
MTRIGDGSRRVCYALPGGELCVKSYRSEEELLTRLRPDGTLENYPLKPSVVSEIRRARHDERRNTSCQEYRYYRALKDRLPPEAFAVFPERLEQIFVPSRGWSLVENIVRNADGSPVRKFAAEYVEADEGLRARLLAAFESLRESLAKYRVRFHDPQNVMVQFDRTGDFRLRIVDFEPASRVLIPLDVWFPLLAAGKVRRRMRRFIGSCRSLV